MTGWWLTYPSGKYDFVTWDENVAYIVENNKYGPNHQPEYHGISTGVGTCHFQVSVGDYIPNSWVMFN